MATLQTETKLRKMLCSIRVIAAVFGAAVAYSGVSTYLSSLPRIDAWGEASLKIYLNTPALSGTVSRNGLFFSASRPLGKSLILDSDDTWREIPGLERYDILHVANDGWIYGRYETKGDPATHTFRSRGEVLVRHWPSIENELIVRDSSPDGETLLVQPSGKNGKPAFYRNGIVDELETRRRTNDRVLTFATKMSEDASTIIGSEHGDSGIGGIMWRNSKHEVISDLQGWAACTAVSPNGRFVALRLDREAFLDDGKSRLRFPRLKAPESSVLRRLSDWWASIRSGATPTRDLEAELQVKFISNDGKFYIANANLKGARFPACYQADCGWVRLEDELLRRGARIETGWHLSSVNGVSDDGRVLIGTARNSALYAPFIIKIAKP